MASRSLFDAWSRAIISNRAKLMNAVSKLYVGAGVNGALQVALSSPTPTNWPGVAEVPRGGHVTMMSPLAVQPEPVHRYPGAHFTVHAVAARAPWTGVLQEPIS